jgi:deoxyribodipyrimidine photo-lyase
MTSIFIFRRDFRLTDNIGLIECFKNSDKILPIFIFTPEQIENNEYFSSNSFQFMLESLDNLNNELIHNYNSQIHYYYGDNIKILKEIYDEYKYDSIYFNKDYTVYSKKRDEEIEKYCVKNNIKYNTSEDYLLSNMGLFLKKDGTPYQKYTPFKNNCKTFTIPKPDNFKFSKKKFDKIKYKFDLQLLNKYYTKNPDILVNGGRDNALKNIKDLDKFINYDSERNDLITPTTHLSAYIKYGCVSIREVYNKILILFGVDHGLINQLLWREFYYYLAYYNPRVLEGKSLKEAYDKIKWDNKKENIEAWKKGMTGFPGVDAGMREMNKTGYMHNRARLITSGILIKILNVDWRIGEKYFAQNLIDYDPIVNNGNWQWSSGSGADSQEYFRIMSPWQQVITNDKECEYIKKWIPELKDVPAKDILKWDESSTKYGNKVKYPKPIVDYKLMRKKIMEVYKDGLY